MKKMLCYLVVLLTTGLVSCTNNDYEQAIPADCSLLMSINTAKVSGVGSPLVLKSMLHVSNLDKTGLDLSANFYFFEDAPGNLGFCAKVADANQFTQTIKQTGIEVVDKRGYHFAALKNNWVVGYSDQAALMMGPVVPAEQESLMARMAGYLDAKEDEGIKGTPMYDKLDSINAPMALVCQAQALPDQFIAPFTLGAPKDADASQVLIAAEMEVKAGCLWMKGETFSWNKDINAALANARNIYRPIQGTYLASMSQTDVMGLFVNVEGKHFIELMRQNKGIKAMLSGINSAIDMDNIIKSIDGDMAIITPTLGDENLQLMMAAHLGNSDWLADVDYWKQSVPAGGHIGDWGRDCYYYTGDGTSYYFGVTQDWQYMSGGSKNAALASIKPAVQPLNAELRGKLKGQKMAMVINLAALQGGKAEAVTGMLKPLFGHVNTMVYLLK
ncbi:MAG: DUF4836 family protein [Prevotella sp.]|nr:DUF4836 family protein [Prevotella sp.]